MNKILKIIGWGLIGAVPFIIGSRILNSLANVIAAYFSISSNLVWVLSIICFLAAVTVAAKKTNLIGQTGIAILNGIGNYVFLVWFWYGKVYQYLIAETGIDPRIILLSLTLTAVAMAALLYYILLDVYESKPSAWKSYFIISTVGSLIICIWMWGQPFVFFEHHVKEEHHIKEARASNNAEIAISKFWILRDVNKAGKPIIDVSWSPGFSSTWGRKLTTGEPKDVKEAMTFLRSNTKLPFVYGNRVRHSNIRTLNGLQIKTFFPQTDPYNLGPLAKGKDLDYWIEIPPNCEWNIKPDNAKYLANFNGKITIKSWGVENFPSYVSPKILITAVEDISNLKLYVWKSKRVKVLTSVQTETVRRGQSPIVVNLNTSGKKVKVVDIHEGDKIYYLSAYKFTINGEDFNDYNLKSSISETHGCKFNFVKSPSGKFPLYFQKKNHPTTVYVWVERS